MLISLKKSHKTSNLKNYYLTWKFPKFKKYLDETKVAMSDK